METLNKKTFKEKIFDYEVLREWNFKGTRPAIIDFYADWCGPCRPVESFDKAIADIFKVTA